MQDKKFITLKDLLYGDGSRVIRIMIYNNATDREIVLGMTAYSFDEARRLFRFRDLDEYQVLGLVEDQNCISVFITHSNQQRIIYESIL